MESKIKGNKRGQVISLLSVLAIALGVFLIVGIAINWNLFIIIAGFVPILAVGLCVIFLPGLAKILYRIIYKRIDKKLTDISEQIR